MALWIPDSLILWHLDLTVWRSGSLGFSGVLAIWFSGAEFLALWFSALWQFGVTQFALVL